MTNPLGFDDNYELVMQKSRARELGIGAERDAVGVLEHVPERGVELHGQRVADRSGDRDARKRRLDGIGDRTIQRKPRNVTE